MLYSDFWFLTPAHSFRRCSRGKVIPAPSVRGCRVSGVARLCLALIGWLGVVLVSCNRSLFVNSRPLQVLYESHEAAKYPNPGRKPHRR